MICRAGLYTLKLLQFPSLDKLLDTIKTELDGACSQAAERSQTELLEKLNQFVRRLRNYQTEGDWVQTTLDAVSPFCLKAALFAVEGETLRLLGQTASGDWSPELTLPLASARAFSTAIDLKDPVTALRTESEVSPVLSEGHASERACVFPIVNGARVSAALFATGESFDMNALELVTGIASSVLERKANSGLHSQIAAAPSPLQSATPTKSNNAATQSHAGKLPAWGELPVDQRQLHIRAQRFARVTLAEIQLARPEACRAGREQGDLYLFLKREIDKARESYRKQFMTVPSMVDYLHLELIQNAAEGDEEKLGVDYPGRLQ